MNKIKMGGRGCNKIPALPEIKSLDIYYDSTKFKGGFKSAWMDQESRCLVIQFEKCRISRNKWFDVCRSYFNRTIIIFDVCVNGFFFKVPVAIVAINSNTHYHRNIKFTAQSTGEIYW